MVHSPESAETAVRSVGTNQKIAGSAKGICMVMMDELAKAKRAIPALMAPIRCVTSVE